MNKLESNDIKIFDDIVKCTRDIAKVYSRLCSIDDFTEDNYNNTDYSLIKIELKKIIEEEQNLYKLLNLNEEKAEILKKHLKSNYGLNNTMYEEPFIAACNDLTEEIWFYRIEQKLLDLVPKFEKGCEHVQNLVKEYGDCLELREYIQEGKLRESISYDFSRVFICFLQDSTVDLEDYSLIVSLSNAIYNMSFITPNIEEELINNNFRSSDEFYFLFPIVADVLNIDHNFMSEIQEDSTFNFCNDAMDALMELNDVGDDEEFLRFNKLILSIYFRAGLAISYCHKDFKNIFDNVILQTMNAENEESRDEFIDSCLESLEDDKQKCMYLSLINPKNKK